ncbi:hypothetical protein D8674_015672 [Pyrus ussuriensis x Pyrus communis]|uniref:UDP-MurNAc-pentapeptide synthetase n=1 Tax=Pyrus ussuriensis x Pyrus communis TaxID=2448454 RepID=A0A5N5HCY8_9ROSA|nr:hypothetical protein D8674_015672 [Pyrus ussuriensis x Pyrus communis]
MSATPTPHSSWHLPSIIKPSRHSISITTKCSINPSSPNPPESESKTLWTVSDIAAAVNGRIVKWGPPGTISTDTRTLQPKQWFFAIAGPNFDAHDFVTPELSRRGCAGVIGNRVCENWDRGFVECHGNTVVSLKKMASYARNRFHGEVVGVTGTVGKTSTKAMIALALESSTGLVHQSHGNWNNEIGVALSLIGMPRNAGVVVLEMGMSGKGEILELARTARPTVRLILNVGASHFCNFSSLEEIAIAKGEILAEAKPGDVCVLNADDPLVMSLPVPYGVKKVLFGRRRTVGCHVRLVVSESTNRGLGVRVVLQNHQEMVEFVIPSPGVHLGVNACAAAAVATLLGVSLSQIGVRLSAFSPVHMRLELEIARNGIKIVNDAYNANPVSTKAAIDVLESIDCRGKRIAILGDMLELGGIEMESHEMILKQCRSARIDLVGLVGERFCAAAASMKSLDEMNIVYAIDSEILVQEIVKMVNCNDVVLVKGSRGLQMEKVVNAIKLMESNNPI